MAYLITGATGLVGQHIVKLCEEQKIKVHYLTTSKGKIKSTPNYKGFYWEPGSHIIDLEAFNGVDTIIHLAGSNVAKRWTKSYKEEIIKSRVETAQLLFDSLKKIKHTVNHYISASAIGIYESSQTEFHTEASLYNSDDFLGFVVKEWEQSADLFSELNIVVSKIRIGVVLASKKGALPKLIKPIKLFVGAAFGNGEQWQSWIHIKDLASIFMYIATNKLGGVFNAVAPNAVSQNKLISLCAEVLKKPIWLPNIPKFIAKIMLGKMSSILLSSHRVSAHKIEKSGFLFEFPSLRKALQFLLIKK